MIWSTFADLGWTYGCGVYLRLRPADVDSGAAYTAGPFTVTNLTGDFNGDLAIDGADLPGFSKAWKASDLSREMGPATGVPPELTVQKDGKMDFEDLAVFVMMWNWYTGQKTAKPVSSAPLDTSAGGPPAAAPPIRFTPGGDGTVAVEGDASVDYLRLVVECGSGTDGGVTFEDASRWTEGENGIVLTRKGSALFEAAAVLLTDRAVSRSGPDRLGRLRFTGTPGEVRIAYAFRESSGDDITTGNVTLAAEDIRPKPAAFSLMQNVPNPFNPSTVIRFALPEAARVRLTVYTVTGQKAAELADCFMEAGYHEVRWNAAGFPSGTYFYTCRAGGHSETRRMLLLK